METDATPSSSRYRNDAVFRSAERLLASTPRKPVRTWPPRSVVFMAGLLCGVALAFWILRSTTNNASDATSPITASAVTPPKPAPSSSVRRDGPAPVPVLTAPPSLPTASVGEPATEPSDTATSGGDTVLSTIPLWPPTTAGASRATTAPLIITTGPITRATLRGHLLDAAGEKVSAVEFALNLSPIGSEKPVYGLIRFIDQPELRDERQVSGTWLGRMLALQQADVLTNTGVRPYGQRNFTLEFPTSAMPMIGRWSHQTSLGTTEGTLSLEVATPQ